MRVLVLVLALAAPPTHAAHAEKPAKAKFKKSLVKNGFEWNCVEIEGESRCFRDFNVCADLREAAMAGMPSWKKVKVPWCEPQKNAVALTYFDEMHEEWRLDVMSRTRHCVNLRKGALRNSDFRGVSKCTKVTSKKRPKPDAGAAED